MHVRKVQLKNFMSYEEASVEFPETGIVLITGANGEGKSAIVDAVSVARYGKTLRGTPWWKDGKDAEVVLEHPNMVIKRSRSAKGTSKLAWSEDHTFDTFSKAEQELAAVLEPFDIWKKCFVFSSRGTASFTTATDGERKKLLEALLGLDKFNPALKKCREELAKARRSLDHLTADLNQKKTVLTYEERDLKNSKERLSSLVESLEPKQDKLQLIYEKLNKCRSTFSKSKKEISSLATAGQAKQNEASVLKMQLQRLSVSECPVCKREIGEDMRLPLKEAIQKATEDARSEIDSVKSRLDYLEEYNQKADETIRKLERMSAQLETEHRMYEKSISDKNSLEHTIENAQDTIKKVQIEILDLEDEVESKRHEVAVLEVCEDVLGLHGVRSKLLSDMLSSLEMVSNKWLEIMSASQVIHFKPYSEKKSGGVTDAISIEIEGAGGGFGYDASSEGQKRRIDVANILALSELAQAAHGISNGTTFFDEVFDILDKQGTLGVVAALEEMAKTRTVVVISHSELIRDLLHPEVRLQVSKGRISRI